MNVQLLSYTPNAERVCAIAARTCYSPDTPSQIANSITDDDIAKVLHRCITSGHLSVLEHASFTFAIDGISRACSHQLVRHRMASFSQQSQRYVEVDAGNDWHVAPPEVDNHVWFRGAMFVAARSYHSMIDDGVSIEDARYALPNATLTNLVVTMNARELRHFFSLRCCRRAQWEIRDLAWAMRKLVVVAAPNMFISSGPACVGKGCTETEPCGKPYGGEA